MELTAESYSVKRAGAKAPVSAHPAFPAIVALWFAALLGLGSLVLPVALLERLVTVTGIAALIPSAAPPLGFTAHAGIALVGAIGGALVGLMLARKVAAAQAPEFTARHFEVETQPRCRPISAHDELGDDGLGSASDAPAPGHKRRSLALAEDNRRSTYLEAAPLPGLASASQAELAPAIDDPAISAEQLDEPVAELLELGDFADLEEFDDHEASESGEKAVLDALRSRIHTSVEPNALQDHSMTDRPDLDQPFASEDGELHEFDAPEEFEPAPDAADPLPFAAPSLRRAGPAFDEEGDDIETNPFAGEPSPHLAVIDSSTEFEPANDGRPLDELGLVQLAARLGASLQKRNARLAAQAAVIAPAPAAPMAGAEDFEAAEAADAARAIADFFGPAKAGEPAESEADFAGEEAEPAFGDTVSAIPRALQLDPLDGDDEVDDDSLAASFSLPLEKSATQPSALGHDEFDEAEEADEDDADYSSLLAMKNPFAREQEFVRVDEPELDGEAIEPVVTFPSPAPIAPVANAAKEPVDTSRRPFDPPRNPAKPAVADAPRDTGDAERNLRAALATLQRMSGAA